MKRFLLYITGLCMLAFGVVLNTKTGLGVQPGILLPFVFANITGITLGTVTILMHIVLVLIQAIIKRKFNLIIILQIPVTMLFGQVIDFFNGLLNIEVENIFMSVLLLCIAMVLAAFGMMLSVSMKIVPVAIDGIVKTISEHFSKPIGWVKIFLDCTLVGVSIIVSIIISGKIIGIGFGTVASALLIGRIAGLFQPWINKLHEVKT